MLRTFCVTVEEKIIGLSVGSNDAKTRYDSYILNAFKFHTNKEKAIENTKQ